VIDIVLVVRGVDLCCGCSGEKQQEIEGWMTPDFAEMLRFDVHSLAGGRWEKAQMSQRLRDDRFAAFIPFPAVEGVKLLAGIGGVSRA